METENLLTIETLESELKKFANDRTYWAKYLAEKILAGNVISDNDIEIAYSYLLEELKLKPETEKPALVINYNADNSSRYKLDLLLSKLENVEGVNALTEDQIIEFSPNLTIIYGVNGSGKSGYVRFLKKAFYSKVFEEIIQNIHLESGHKPISAKFTFTSNSSDIHINYPANSAFAEFEQYKVFDWKSVIARLDHKNEYEFRPAGLSFFETFTEAINRVEEKRNEEVTKRQSENNFHLLFEGESEIKTIIQNLSAQTKLDDLKQYTPFSEEDKIEKEKIEKQYDELLLASRGKEKEIQLLESIKKQLGENKKTIENLNKYFVDERLIKIKNAISDCIKKEATAKAEGIENFKTDKIIAVGASEWRDFIIAAEAFAKKQKEEFTYPQEEDNCLLCHQPLSEEGQKLIVNYWAFIKSVAEENAKKAQELLTTVKTGFEKLIFDLFPNENTLTVWLLDKHPNILSKLKSNLSEQKTLSENIISDINSKIENSRVEIKISTTDHDNIENIIDASIKLLKENKQNVELQRLLKEKTKLAHKEKFNAHYANIETYVSSQIWIKTANKVNFGKKKVTDTEKDFSDRYYNQKYVDIFNEECVNLNGNFGIEINHTGSGGKSYRQLKLKGRNPNNVLSEGEQKVIAIADFLTEMKLSKINRGIIFDDPVTSLDEGRKKDIALRLVRETSSKQVVIFTHDLIFVSNLITFSEENKTSFLCHWIENRNGKPGQVWLRNSPSYEREYRNVEPVKKLYSESNKNDCPPTQREFLVKSGFAALRTCYEVLVINGLFKDVVQRYNERVSMESLKDVYFDEALILELSESFAQCCRYMEGHTHSDKYAYKKPEPENLNEEMQRYEAIRAKIKKTKRPS